ncbi:MAG: orotidine-5'-phosphate decarboxylase, partial [Planctomycetota bacterium]
MTAYADRLHAAIRAKRTPALVGIDPRLDLLPADIVERNRTPERTAAEAAAGAFEEFSKRLIDAVAPLVPAVKPQAAFFEEYGPPGMAALGRVVAHARTAGLITILDAKRGDIGSTAEAYARGWLGGADPDHPWQADALTVNPYLGADTLEPFVKTATERGAGLYVLVRTSNPGAAAFQDVCEGATNVFERVADVVESLSSGDAAYGPVGAVVGATYPEELK